MKKTFLLLCIPALLFTGCARLEIPNTDSTADTETTTDDSDDKEDDTASTGTTGTVDPELSWSDSA